MAAYKGDVHHFQRRRVCCPWTFCGGTVPRGGRRERGPHDNDEQRHGEQSGVEEQELNHIKDTYSSGSHRSPLAQSLI
jgi:hypothetical protein